jgi:hypothetical protein
MPRGRGASCLDDTLLSNDMFRNVMCFVSVVFWVVLFTGIVSLAQLETGSAAKTPLIINVVCASVPCFVFVVSMAIAMCNRCGDYMNERPAR